MIKKIHLASINQNKTSIAIIMSNIKQALLEIKRIFYDSKRVNLTIQIYTCLTSHQNTVKAKTNIKRKNK